MRRAFLVGLCLVAACDRAAPDPATTGLDRALVTVSSAWTVEPGSRAPIVLTADAITMEGLDAPIGVSGHRVAPEEKRGRAEGFLIERLHEALIDQAHAGRLERSPPRQLSLAVAPATPFGVLSEVVYTAAQAEQAELRLLVRRASGRIGALPVALPRFGDPCAAASVVPTPTEPFVDGDGDSEERPDEEVLSAALPEAEAEAEDDRDPRRDEDDASQPREIAAHRWPASVRVTTATALVRTFEGDACQAADAGALRRCLERVHRRRSEDDRVVALPSDERAREAADLDTLARSVEGLHHRRCDRVVVSADVDVPFARVAEVMAMARGSKDAPLFSEVALAVDPR